MIQPSNTPGPFVTIVTIFPGSIFSHCREDCLWRLQVWQWMFYDLAGKAFLTPSPHTCAPWNAPLDSHSNSSLGNREWEHFVPKSILSRDTAVTQQAAAGQVTPQWHQNLTSCRAAGGGDLYTQRSRKAQFRTTIGRGEPWTPMCLPGSKEKLLKSDNRFQKLLNYTPRRV